MKKIYYAALVYLAAGLVAGIYYREVTKATDFTGDTMLSVLHTHLLTLGLFFFLIVLLLEKSFALSESRLFNPFFWIYNLGVIWTVALLAVHGTMTVFGAGDSAAIAGIAGLGHIILTGGFILFFIMLKERIGISGKK